MSWDEVAMDMSKLQTSDSKIQMVKDFKKITEDSGLNIFMYGWNYVMIEQFINLEYFFWVTVGISMIVCCGRGPNHTAFLARVPPTPVARHTTDRPSRARTSPTPSRAKPWPSLSRAQPALLARPLTQALERTLSRLALLPQPQVVMVCSLLLGISFVGAALIAFFSMALCLEVYGSLYAFGVDYQTLAATSVIASIGVSVEFVAHTVAAFEFASGSRDQRLGEALSKTGKRRCSRRLLDSLLHVAGLHGAHALR